MGYMKLKASGAHSTGKINTNQIIDVTPELDLLEAIPFTNIGGTASSITCLHASAGQISNLDQLIFKPSSNTTCKRVQIGTVTSNTSTGSTVQNSTALHGAAWNNNQFHASAYVIPPGTVITSVGTRNTWATGTMTVGICQKTSQYNYTPVALVDISVPNTGVWTTGALSYTTPSSGTYCMCTWGAGATGYSGVNATWGDFATTLSSKPTVGSSINAPNDNSANYSVVAQYTTLSGTTYTISSMYDDTGIAPSALPGAIYKQWSPQSTFGILDSSTTSNLILNSTSSSAASSGDIISCNGKDITFGSVTPSNINTYATLGTNANDYNSYGTKSNGNLTLTWNNGGYASAKTNIPMSSGKFYAEVTIVSGNDSLFGVTNGFINSFGSYVGNSITGWSYWGSGASRYHISALGAWGPTLTPGDVLGIAIDVDNKKMFLRKNGTWMNSSDPVAGTGYAFNDLVGPLYFACSLNGSSVTWNFGASSFQSAIPSGYSALTSTTYTCTSMSPSLTSVPSYVAKYPMLMTMFAGDSAEVITVDKVLTLGSSAATNVMPVMSGMTNGAITITNNYSSVGGREAWHAFDRVADTGALNSCAQVYCPAGTTDAYIQIDFGSATTLGGYTLQCLPSGYNVYQSQAWKIMGSNTGSFSGEQVDIDVRTGQSWAAAEKKSFTFASPATYRYWRYLATQGGSTGGANVAYLIDAMELLSPAGSSTTSQLVTSQTSSLLPYFKTNDITKILTCTVNGNPVNVNWSGTVNESSTGGGTTYSVGMSSYTTNQGSPNLYAQNYFAQSFTVPNTNQITKAKWGVYPSGGGQGLPVTLTVTINADNGGQPTGAVLATASVTWTDTSVYNTWQEVTFTPFTPATGTTYWLKVFNTAASGFFNNPVQVGDNGAYTGGHYNYNGTNYASQGIYFGIAQTSTLTYNTTISLASTLAAVPTTAKIKNKYNLPSPVSSITYVDATPTLHLTGAKVTPTSNVNLKQIGIQVVGSDFGRVKGVKFTPYIVASATDVIFTMSGGVSSNETATPIGSLTQADCTLTQVGSISAASSGWRTLNGTNQYFAVPANLCTTMFRNNTWSFSMRMRNMAVGNGHYFFDLDPSGSGRFFLINIAGGGSGEVEPFGAYGAFTTTPASANTIWFSVWKDGTNNIRSGWTTSSTRPSKWSDFPTNQRMTLSAATVSAATTSFNNASIGCYYNGGSPIYFTGFDVNQIVFSKTALTDA